jgi:hypothetical protein
VQRGASCRDKICVLIHCLFYQLFVCDRNFVYAFSGAVKNEKKFFTFDGKKSLEINDTVN